MTSHQLFESETDNIPGVVFGYGSWKFTTMKKPFWKNGSSNHRQFQVHGRKLYSFVALSKSVVDTKKFSFSGSSKHQRVKLYRLHLMKYLDSSHVCTINNGGLRQNRLIFQKFHFEMFN